MKNDSFGNRMKDYESRETSRRFLPFIPIYARVDGRSFSKFTKLADKPFDHSIVNAMQAASRELVSQTGALLCYTQSDEMSLVWETTEQGEQMFFDGKVQKMASVLSGIATSAFIRALDRDEVWNAKNTFWLERMPHFDARVVQMPNRVEATNMFVWREMDARKNAISMIASSMFSHKSLHGKSGGDKIKMMEEKGVALDSYPDSLLRGAFMRRVVCEVVLDEAQRLAIPAKSRPAAGTMVTRGSVDVIPMPRFTTVLNRVEVIFEGAEPRVEE